MKEFSFLTSSGDVAAAGRLVPLFYLHFAPGILPSQLSSQKLGLLWPQGLCISPDISRNQGAFSRSLIKCYFTSEILPDHLTFIIIYLFSRDKWS